MCVSCLETVHLQMSSAKWLKPSAIFGSQSSPHAFSRHALRGLTRLLSL